MRYLLLVLGISCYDAFSQCGPLNLTLKENACLGENLVVTTNEPGDQYAWDFCAGDLRNAPTVSEVLVNSNFFRARSLRIIKDGDQWFGFAISATANILMRLDFGSDLTSVPTFTNIGNVSGLLSSAFSFEILKVNDTWYLFVANGGNKNIVRYSFENGLTVPPTGTILSTPGVFDAAGPNFIRIVRDQDNFHAFVPVGTSVATSKIIRLDLGNSISNNTPATAELSVTSANQLRGMDIIRECDEWIGLVTSVSTNAVHRLNFGSNISSVPTEGVVYTAGLLNQPVSLELRNEGGRFIAYVQGARSDAPNAALYRIDFKNSVRNNVPATTKLAFPQLTGGGYSLDLITIDSQWYGYTFNLGTQTLIRYTFPDNCSANQSVSDMNDPLLLNYENQGEYYVTLKITAQNYVEYQLDSVQISGNNAPDISFYSENVCVDNDVNFFSQNVSNDITDFEWTFGDGDQSLSENPIHQYATAGSYVVLLDVTAENLCKNVFKDTLTMFEQPQADFDIPPDVSLFCTNQLYIFYNTSDFDPGTAPQWQWEVNGNSVSTDENLNFSFSSTSSQDILLRATIPGCFTEHLQSIASLQNGPITDFIFSGSCEGELIAFNNASSGDINSFSWDFDDGNHSNEISPMHAFDDFGIFEVTLTASNSEGCDNSVTKPVTIRSKPLTDFSVALPPFSCSGSPTIFNNLTPNLTDSNIDSWAWNFGDPASGQNTSVIKNPQHTYTTAGEYDVFLTATTNFDCSSTIQLPVVISETPTVDFTHSATCEDIAINFSGTSTAVVQAWDWQIGSSFYSGQNPTHLFANPIATNALLTVTGTNNCINSITKPIVVPAKLAPDFAVSKNCINQQTLFTDITNTSADPVSAFAWDFDGLGTAAGSPVTFTFSEIGNRNITLTLTTQTGCEYVITKPVTIEFAPQAAFTPSPEAGAVPLLVQFTNTSTGATSYHWNFDDPENSTSMAVSPSFMFQGVGEFDVRLIAYNLLNCSDTSNQIVIVEAITSTEGDLNFYRKAYPNPTPGNLFLEWIDYQPGELAMAILDNFGRQILTVNLSSVAGLNQASLDLNGLPAGVYFLQMRLRDEKKMVRVIITPE